MNSTMDDGWDAIDHEHKHAAEGLEVLGQLYAAKGNHLRALELVTADRGLTLEEANPGMSRAEILGIAADDAPRDIRTMLAIAKSEGICQWSFLHEDHRFLWLAAEQSKTAQQAIRLARMALQHFGFWEQYWNCGRFEQFLDGWNWSTSAMRRAARQLHTTERAAFEVDCCLIRRREVRKR